MGLDMCLYRIQCIRNWDYPNADEFKLNITKNGEPFAIIGKPSYIKSEVMYWRKANAIHNWFVQNCQDGVDDCSNYHVSIDHLEQLLDVVTQLLGNHKLADDLLPTSKGFFFGSVDYDEWYFKELEEIYFLLEFLIETNEDSVSYEYTSSW